MAFLGDMVVRIKGDTGELVKSLAATERGVKRFTAGLRTLAGLGGAILAFQQLGRAVNNIVKLINDQQEAEGRLASAIRATGKETSISVSSIAGLANQLQRTTIYGDEVTLTAAAMLQQLADLDEQGLKRLIPRVQNFAAAMGLDLVDAAKLVGKTLGTSTNALARQGIEIDKNATGADRLNAVVKGLDDKFSGMAETIGKTTIGQLKILRAQFDDIQQSLALKLLPVINTVLGALNRVLTDMTSSREKFIALKQAMDLKWAISSYENATAAIATLENEIKRMTDWYTAQGAPVDRKRIEAWEKQLTLVRQAVPMLDAQASATKKATPPTTQLAEETEKVALATFNARTEYDMMLRRLNDDLPEAVANARNEFGMLGRQMEEMREKFEFSFGAEQLRDWEEASKKLSASMMADQDAVTENLKENVDYRNQLMSGFASTISGMINAISGYWNAYYSNLLQNEKLTDEERKKIQYEQAKKAKNLALFNAIITGTEAIINGFATKPFFPLGIAMGALATALTAVQIGAIAAQPLPKLAKGGKLIRPTLFLGGEAGAEYVVPELKLDELGQRITSAMRDTRITNTFTDDRPIQLSINLDGRQLDAHIQRSISNRRILVEEGSVA